MLGGLAPRSPSRAGSLPLGELHSLQSRQAGASLTLSFKHPLCSELGTHRCVHMVFSLQEIVQRLGQDKRQETDDLTACDTHGGSDFYGPLCWQLGTQVRSRHCPTEQGEGARGVAT